MSASINLGIALGLAWPVLLVLLVLGLRSARAAFIAERVATKMAIRRARIAERAIASGLFQ